MEGKIEKWHNHDGEHFYSWELYQDGKRRAFSENDWESYKEAYQDLDTFVAELSRLGVNMPSEDEIC